MTQFKGTPGPWKWTSDLVNEGNALIGNNGNFVFYGDNICAGLSNDDVDGEFIAHPLGCNFRPLRTEAERAIDEMVRLSGVSIGAAKILYDAGYRKE